MLKKIICIIMSLTVIIGISACGSGQKSSGNTGSTGENGKTAISIAALSNDRYLESAIEKYKELHPEIMINLQTYSATPNNTGAVSKSGDAAGGKSGGKRVNEIIGGAADPKDIEKYVNTLNTEIMTGKAPDIISVDLLPYRKYADKNLLTDLNTLIQSDNSFDMEQYYKGVLDAVKYNDKLFAIPIKFSLDMLCGDKTVLDDPSFGLDDSKWTWQDFKTISEKIINSSGKQDMTALTNVSQLELLNYVMGSSYDRFIDMDKKSADFTNPEFKEILTFCKELLDTKLVDTQTERKMTGRGNTVFSMSQISRPITYLTMQQSEFNGNGKFYKLPGNGEAEALSFSSDAMFAISNNSAHKEEAWEFIKYLLSDEVQSGMEFSGFPVNKAAAKANASKSSEMIEKGSIKIKTPEGDVNLKPATEKDLTEMEKLIEKVSRYDGSDREILKIILEDADSFFKGIKTVDEAAALIQNRVDTYLKE